MFRLFRFLPTHWWRPSAWKTWWTYVHWRLETYGVYYPDGKLHAHSLWTLLRQLSSYLRWLKEIDLHRGLVPTPHK